MSEQIQNVGLASTLRQDVASYGAKAIDMQSIQFQQGREIARTYVDMMKSYARLDAKSGRFMQHGNQMLVEGFCRIEEQHFDKPLLIRTRKQSFVTGKWKEIISLKIASDVFAAFCTSFEEICKEENIQLGGLCALIYGKEGKLQQKPFPVEVVLPNYLVAIGFPYTIAF